MKSVQEGRWMRERPPAYFSNDREAKANAHPEGRESKGPKKPKAGLKKRIRKLFTGEKTERKRRRPD